MTVHICPNCRQEAASVEATVYNEDVFEETTCSVCGYYDSKIIELSPHPDRGTLPDDFEF